jgi:molybdopterin-guanine dinucleotide biosynthesis protein A
MYYHPVSELAAFVLAGGKSTRMGRDKAFVELDGQTLLLRVLGLVRAVAPDVAIVGDREKFSSFGPVVEDVFRERGPLGGIHAALAKTEAELNLMMAVDLPFVEPRFLEYLISQARDCKAAVTVPHVDDGWQPLCAVYRRAFATTAEQALIAGNNKIDLLFAQVQTRVVNETEIIKLGFSGTMFRNLNSVEDLEGARRIIS